eukprot:365836-Chlamydomonas_euryale.AAC.4
MSSPPTSWLTAAHLGKAQPSFGSACVENDRTIEAVVPPPPYPVRPCLGDWCVQVWTPALFAPVSGSCT